MPDAISDILSNRLIVVVAVRVRVPGIVSGTVLDHLLGAIHTAVLSS